jgi:hypothetical protein
LICSSRFKEHGSATTWSDCSRAKPTAHTGTGIKTNTAVQLELQKILHDCIVKVNISDEFLTDFDTVVSEKIAKYGTALWEFVRRRICIYNFAKNRNAR